MTTEVAEMRDDWYGRQGKRAEMAVDKHDSGDVGQWVQQQ